MAITTIKSINIEPTLLSKINNSISDAPSDGKTYARKNAAWSEFDIVDEDYPLDDDGTLATSVGFGFAGVARGDGQKLDYETAGGSGVKMLMAKDTFTTARFSRDATATIGYEAVCVKKGIGTGGSSGLVLVISDSSGALVNMASIDLSNTNDLGQFFVDSIGTISAKLNGSAYSLAGNWMNPSGQKTVGASDKFAPFLYTTDNGTTGERDIVQLITDASKMSGEYPFGAKDIHGRLI